MMRGLLKAGLKGLINVALKPFGREAADLRRFLKVFINGLLRPFGYEAGRDGASGALRLRRLILSNVRKLSGRSWALDLRALRVDMDEDSFIITDVCPQCGHETLFHNRGDFRPWLAIGSAGSAGSAGWVCGGCGAGRFWEATLARQALWRLFDGHINNFVPVAEGVLKPEDLAWIKTAVNLLKPLAPISFLAFDKVIGHMVLGGHVLLASLAGKDTENLDLDNDGMFLYVSLLDTEDINPAYVDIFNKTLLGYPFNAGFRIRYYPPARQIIDDKILAHLALNDNFIYNRKHDFQLAWTRGDYEKAGRYLADMNIKKTGGGGGEKIALLLVRDSFWHRGDDVRDTYPGREVYRIRNADVDTYREAAEYLAANGYYVLRMGYRVEKKIAWESDRIIDYANRYRSAFMDLWLFAHCDLVLTTCTGPDVISALMGKNMIITNNIMEFNHFQHFGPLVMLYKKIRKRADGRLVSMQEFFRRGGEFVAERMKRLRDESADHRNILDWVIEDNTSGEILDATKEMLEMLAGVHAPTAAEEENQRAFRDMPENFFARRGYPVAPDSRLARSMLNKTPILEGAARPAGGA